MEKSGRPARSHNEAAPLHAPGRLCTTHPIHGKEKGRGGGAGRGRRKGTPAAQGGRRQEAGNRRTGTTSLLGVRKSLPLPGPVRVRVCAFACACACASCLGKLSRLSSGRTKTHARGEHRNHMPLSCSSPMCLERLGARGKNVWTLLTVCSKLERLANPPCGVPAGSKSEDENLPYRMAQSALLRRGAVTRKPAPRL